MIYYLDNIADTIKQYLPQLDKAVYLARIDDEGRVLMPSPDNQVEYVYAGIRDNDSNYFYIRHRDSGEIFYSEPSSLKQITCSQSSVVARYELRVVVSIRNSCPYNTEEMIRRALYNVNLPDYNTNNNSSQYITNASITLVKSMIDSIAVMKEETPDKKKQFDKNINFIAVDFDLEMELSYF